MLQERLSEARAGRPQIVYLEAAPGSGKSTLLSHFAASLNGARVLALSADEDEMMLSYGVIDQLRPSVSTDPGDDPMIVGARLVDLLDQL